MKFVSKIIKLPMLLLSFALLTNCGNLISDSKTSYNKINDVIDETEIDGNDKEDTKSKIQIVFNAGDGTFSTGMHTKTHQFRKGLSWGRIKNNAPKATDISYDRHKLASWQYDDNGTKKDLTDNFVFKENIILYAKYSEVTFVNATFKIGNVSESSYCFPNGATTKYARFESGVTFGEIFSNAYKPAYKYSSSYWRNYKVFDYYIDDQKVKVTDDYKFNRDGIVLTAQWKDRETEYTTSSFCNDSWDTFAKAVNNNRWEAHWFLSNTEKGANGGYKEDYVAKKFTFDGKQYNKRENTFVGLMRKLKVNGQEYTIRVVGEMSDRSYQDSYCYSALTFEFVDVIEVGVGYNYASNPYNTWSNSFIKDYLNNQFMSQVEDKELKDIIIQTDKTTCNGKGSDKTSRTGDYFFLPSLYELGIREIEVAEGSKITVATEGLPRYDGDNWIFNGSYDYYYDEEQSKSRSMSLVKKYNGMATNYYLRSPHTDTDSFAWYANSSGVVNESSEVTVGLGISPMFSVGIEEVY